MGRGKVQLKRIEDKVRRQVTFSKRRSGLFNKARELSVLCGVEVGLIIFSAKGRLYEFCSGDSLGNVLEHYQIHNEEEIALPKNSKKKHLELNDTCTKESLPMIQRKLSELITQNTEDLDVLELTQLEKQLDGLSRQIISRKREDTIDYLPGVEAIGLKDLMSDINRTDTSAPMLRLITKAFRQVKTADFILCNTIQELESESHSALQRKQPTYAIGPVCPIELNNSNVSTNLIPEIDCIEWLKTKPKA